MPRRLSPPCIPIYYNRHDHEEHNQTTPESGLEQSNQPSSSSSDDQKYERSGHWGSGKLDQQLEEHHNNDR